MFGGSSFFVPVTVLMLFCVNQLAVGQTTGQLYIIFMVYV